VILPRNVATRSLALTVVSGFTGLAYEVTWQKYLAILLGAHSEATAAVLGLFRAGCRWVLAVRALTRRLVARVARAVVGAAARGVRSRGGEHRRVVSPLPVVVPAVRSASVWLPTGAGALAFGVDVALAAALIVPPRR